MSDNVVNIGDYKPHISLLADKDIHVFPVQMFEDIVEGKLCITDIARWEPIMKALIKDWLTTLEDIK